VLVPAAILGFSRKLMWTVLLAIVLGVVAARGDLRHLLGPDSKMAQAVADAHVL
jgi:hypothetical protein